MATSEADFKKEFREALKKEYGEKAHINAVNDRFKTGTADISAIYRGTGFSIEAKFVDELPKSMQAKVLKHNVTGAQRAFLKNTYLAEGYSIVLIGFNLECFQSIIETAVAVPYILYDKYNAEITRETLERIPRELYFTKDRKEGWQVKNFFEKAVQYGKQNPKNPILF